MKHGKELTMAQEKLIDQCGLFHTDWMCHYEDNTYLHIIRKCSGPAEIRIIDKAKKKVL